MTQSEVPTTRSAASQRAAPGLKAGVTEEMIRVQVHTFYAAVREDMVLGPIFERAVDDWDAHLAKLCDFWSSVLLATSRFEGRPMATHLRLGDLGPGHFQRWLALFEQTARVTCPPPAAALFIARARMIAQSFQLGMAVARGQTPDI